MTIPAGTRLGPYELSEMLGAGGMGEVYKARDTRLERNVAIKVLPAHLSSNPSLRERFEREAKTISAITHPNICALYDIGAAVVETVSGGPVGAPRRGAREDDATDHGRATGATLQESVQFLVMEYLEGESLAERLAKGPLPLEHVLRYGFEIASALDKAHRAGIIHRDLKPGNIMITKSGAKLLDFGLAKYAQSVQAIEHLTSLPTEHKPLTQEGTILGTFQYMAPEQLAGEEADARTDIFALGAVLYEMLTGTRAFQGKNKTSLIGAIVSGEPRPINALQPLTPPALEHVIKKCLAKEPDDRWQSAHDIAGELKWISEAGSQAGVATPIAVRRRRRDSVQIALAALLAVAAIAAGMLWRGAQRDLAQARRPIRFLLQAPPEGMFTGTVAVVSPDGRHIAFTARREREADVLLWVRDLDTSQARALEGTEGAYAPFWSFDGQSIAFFSDGKLKRVPFAGGSSVAICAASLGRGGAWSQDGTIIFAPTTFTSLMRVPASGGTPSPVFGLDASQQERGQRHPVFLPNGRDFLYQSVGGLKPGIYVATSDGKRKRLVESNGSADFAAGYLFFVRDSNLMAQRLDSRTFEPEGEPISLQAGISVNFNTTRAGFSVSDDVLVMRSGSGDDFQLTWLDRTGKTIGIHGPLGNYDHPSLSPDGKRLALDRGLGGSVTRDVWVVDLEGDRMSRLTFDAATDWCPTWSPDGKRIAFASDRDTFQELWIKSATGVTPEEKLVPSKERQHHLHWSLDGTTIAEERLGEKSEQDIWLVDVATRAARPIVATPFNDVTPQISPDGRWLAYASMETGQFEVYVLALPDGSGKWQISTAGGTGPRWRRDGRELYYLKSGRMMAVEINADESFQAGVPKALFEAATLNDHAYDVTADGQRFIMPLASDRWAGAPMEVLVNWRQVVER